MCIYVHFEYMLYISIFISTQNNVASLRILSVIARKSGWVMSPVLVSSSQQTETVEAAMQAF